MNAKITRKQYIKLLEILNLIRDKLEIASLFRFVKSLRHNIRAHLSLLQLKRQKVHLKLEKLLTYVAALKRSRISISSLMTYLY